MRKPASAFLLLLLLLAGSVASQTNEWKKYKNTNGNFSVLFPDEPQDTVNKNDSGIDSHTLLAREKPASYAVVYANMAREQTVDDASFVEFKNAVFKSLPKCEVRAERPVSPVIDGYIGRGYRLSCSTPHAQMTVTGNLYWGRHHSYAVMAMFPSNVSEPATVNTFVESFSIVDPAK